MNRKLIHGLIPIVVIGAAATLGAIVSAQSTRANAQKKETAAAIKAPAPDVDVQEQADRKPLSFYVSSVKGDLFAPELPHPPKVIAKPAPIITTPPAPVNPLADYAYTGTVEMNGTKMALVENVKTKEGQYLKVGDSFMGGTVSRLDDRTVGVMVAKTEQTMAKRDDYSLTSLDKNAPFLNAQQQAPGQAGPGAPGAPSPDGGMPGMGGMGGANAWRQRFQNMTPEQRQQMQQRMLNRQFDRGGRGGGGGGRGGRGGGGGGGMMNFFGGG